MLSAIFWDPAKEVFSFSIPFIERSLLWYGLFFSLGIFLAYWILQALFTDELNDKQTFSEQDAKKQARILADRLSLRLIIATIIGARVGDLLFYQSGFAWRDLLSLFRFWEPGLASHGAVCAIFLTLVGFYWIEKRKGSKTIISFWKTLDCLCIAALVPAFCIRIGNFFNQEILGTNSNLPWAVVFGHPVDGSFPIARHPVQLYEAFFYLFLFVLFYSLYKRSSALRHRTGYMSSIFFITLFTFRFFIEFFKAPQSVLLKPDSFLDMGQLLSIPCIFFGVFFLFLRRQNFRRLDAVKGNEG